MTNKVLLITGAPHSGTRLLLRMLARHPEISVPEHILNSVGEFYPLHKYFVRMIDRTPLQDAHYFFDYEELAFLLDSYMQATDSAKPMAVVKMPFYPLNCLEFLHNHFRNKLHVVFTSRDPEKIYSSYSRRGADVIFNRHPDEHVRQVKKLPVSQRRQFLTEPDKGKLIREIVRSTEAKKDAWNASHPESFITSIKVSDLAKSEDLLKQLLQNLNLPQEHVHEMHRVLDQNRLMVGKTVKLKDLFWKNWSRLKEQYRKR